ncbi:HIT family protein [Gemmatimonas aurantiaca]|uniref:HIT family protein n=1 Tax=Gemmatimonas aurantiaca TaxID=173480 RepID=UPI00301C57F0
MSQCIFCRIAVKEVDAVIVYEDEHIMAFLDIGPIRPGHTQIIAKSHVATFEELPPALAARILHLGQQLARRMKQVYAVDRVAFLFTGGDVAHVHAHVVPMHEKTDITSARYLVGSDRPVWGSEHLMVHRQILENVRTELGFVTSPDV